MIHQLPPILILHMKRFEIGFDDVTKDDRHISFPEVLDMAPYCTAECLKVCAYTIDRDILVLNKFRQYHYCTKFKHTKYTLTEIFKHTCGNFTKVKLVEYFAHASLLPMKYSQSTVHTIYTYMADLEG